MAARPLIVFDVNETLLDLEAMEPTFRRIFGEKSAMRLWFANLIMYSAALTVAGCWEAALIKRVGNDVLGVGPQPQIVGNDLNDVANQLIARHKRRPAAGDRLGQWHAS
jgi:phosphoserine phosphatase